MHKKLLYIILVLLISQPLFAKKKKAEDLLDHMALATMMVYDGNFEKADEELKLVDTTKKKFDFAKYFTLQGIVAMKLFNYKDAVVYFSEAIESTKVKVYQKPKSKKERKSFDPEKLRDNQIGKLKLYTAEAYYKLKNYRKTIETLDSAGEAGVAKAQLFTLRADCYWKLKEYSPALNALSDGYMKFTDAHSLLKQKFYYLLDLGFFQAAQEIADDYFKIAKPNAKEYIAFAQALHGGGELDKAIKLLENAKLKFSKEPKVSKLLGHLYLKKDMLHTTADLFEKSSYYDTKYTHEAAEMYRRTKAFPHSMYLNTQIPDQTEKVKQKIAIFIEQGEFAKVIGLKNSLYRYNMLEDENLRYALAYAYFMSKEYSKAEFHLKKLTKSDLFSKATVIRKNIEKCKNNSMECL